MESIFDVNNQALAILLSGDKGQERVFWNIGINYDDYDWLNRAKLMFEETLKMKKHIK